MEAARVLARSSAVDEHAEFAESEAAIEAIGAYVRRLSAMAAERRLRREEVCDQSLPIELFALRPRRTAVPPLVLLGGMGPVAGAIGFARACAIFGQSREIVLLQACSIPDRTQAVLADARSRTGSSPEHLAVVDALEAALREAMRHVASPRAVDVIALCNAAHAFLPDVFARMTGGDVRPISLAECVVDALGQRRSRPALILSTTGTRVSRVFTRRLDEEGVRYVEPSDQVQEELMRAIYAGVKALDWKTAAAAGERVLTGILATNPDIGCIVAGCTEIPQVLELVKGSGSEELKQRLARIEVLDPVELAFSAVAGGGRGA